MRTLHTTKTRARDCGACLSSRASRWAHLLVPLVGTVVRYAVKGVEVFLPRRVGLPEDAPRAVVHIVSVERHPWDCLRVPRGSFMGAKSVVDIKIALPGGALQICVEIWRYNSVSKYYPSEYTRNTPAVNSVKVAGLQLSYCSCVIRMICHACSRD